MKAMRSRCDGSMFACTLKTKRGEPVVVGLHDAVARQRGPGGGHRSTKSSRKGSTPKLVSALPKKTGVCSPAQEAGGPSRRPRPRAARPRRAASPAGSSPRSSSSVGSSMTARLATGARNVAAACRSKRSTARCSQVVDALEEVAAADRPGERHGVEPEHLLDLAHQLEGVARRPIELVHEGDDRGSAHAADMEQLARLRLDALGGVDQHDGAVRRGERPVGVLAEVLVARGIEQVVMDAAEARTAARSR